MCEAPCVMLATVTDGRPHIAALENLRNEFLHPRQAALLRANATEVLLSTSAGTGKVKALRAHPQAAIYYCVAELHQSVEFQGEVEILDDLALKQALWEDDWRCYWPSGAGDPDYVLLRMRPHLARGWIGRSAYSLELGNE